MFTAVFTRALRRVLASIVLAMVVALVVVAAGCSGDSGSSDAKRTTTTTIAPETARAAYLSDVATARGPSISVYAGPDEVEPMLVLDNPWVVDPDEPGATVPQVFLVKDQDPAAPGAEEPPDEWVEVLLPVRPNGSTGWVRRAEVTLAPNPYRIEVELAAHRITVTNADSILYQGSVAAGAADTPTPTGTYYLRVLLQAPDPNTVYGPFAYGLSSHSDALETFNGGDGEIGIHGNNDASVLGQDVTHGCVRIDNTAITALASQLPLGTPVDIVA